MNTPKKLAFPLSKDLSNQLGSALLEKIFQNSTAPGASDTTLKKRLSNSMAGVRSWNRSVSRALKEAAPMRDKMLARLEANQATMQAQEKALAALGFAYSDLTGWFQLPVGAAVLHLHHTEAGVAACTLTNGKKEVGHWPILDLAADLPRVIEEAKTRAN